MPNVKVAGLPFVLLVGTSQNLLLKRLWSSVRSIQQIGSIFLSLVGTGLIHFTLDAGRFQAIVSIAEPIA